LLLALLALGIDKYNVISHTDLRCDVVDGTEVEILVIKEITDYLKLTEKTAYCLAAESELHKSKVGGSWRFSMQEIDDRIKKQSQK
jgi:excisionase family DNA binding protein